MVHKASTLKWADPILSFLYTTISQSYMMGVAMECYFHSEKYRSNIKKMYQNFYSLRVAIKTGAMWRSARSACLTTLSDNDLFTVQCYIQSISHISASKERCWLSDKMVQVMVEVLWILPDDVFKEARSKTRRWQNKMRQNRINITFHLNVILLNTAFNDYSTIQMSLKENVTC